MPSSGYWSSSLPMQESTNRELALEHPVLSSMDQFGTTTGHRLADGVEHIVEIGCSEMLMTGSGVDGPICFSVVLSKKCHCRVPSRQICLMQLWRVNMMPSSQEKITQFRFSLSFGELCAEPKAIQSS